MRLFLPFRLRSLSADLPEMARQFYWPMMIVGLPLAYLGIWLFLGNDFLARVGFEFWKSGWPVNESVQLVRITLIRVFLAYAMPVLIAVNALGWWVIRRRRRGSD
jgi:hypothetical protein